MISTAFTLYTRIPGDYFDGLPVENPESFVRFVEKNPEKAQEIIAKAIENGIFD